MTTTKKLKDKKMEKKFKKQLKESEIITIHSYNSEMYAIPKRIITKEERDIMILLINNLPCDEHK
jgi:hypothetical protein